MLKPIIATVLAFTIGAAASARTLDLVEGAYELTLGEVSMPRSPVGTAAFRTCTSCKTIALTVTTRTRYEINGRTYYLPDFLELVTKIRQRDGGNGTTTVGVYYGIDSKQITRIAVFPEN